LEGRVVRLGRLKYCKKSNKGWAIYFDILKEESNGYSKVCEIMRISWRLDVGLKVGIPK
jgi:hypothetical protein